MFPFLQNPQSIAIKKYLFEILQERYLKNERFIERLSSTILTKEDYDGLGSFVTDIFELGFLRATNQYKDQLNKMGINVNIVAEQSNKKNNNKIFNQEEKSG
jgi:hypothetical protein